MRDTKLNFKTLNYEISWGCNISCPMCTFHNEHHHNEVASLENVYKLTEGLENFKHIHIGDGSEPLINPNWNEIICYFKKHKKTVSLQTNGKNIKTIEIAKKIVMSGLDSLSISIDGINDETVSYIRKGITYKEIINAIDLINQAKLELNSNTPNLVSNIVAMKLNLNQLEELTNILVQKNFKRIRIGFLELREENLNLLKNLLIYCEDDTYKVINKLRKKFQSLDTVLDVSIFDDDNKVSKLNNCPAYYENMYLRQDGNLYTCYGKLLLGNVYLTGLSKCLESSIYSKYQDTITQENNDICSTCSYCKIMTFNDIQSHISNNLISLYGEKTIKDSICLNNYEAVSNYWDEYYKNNITIENI